MAVSGIIFQMITLFIMMFAGYLAARAGLISPSFRRGLSSLVLSTAFPCCIVSSVLQSGGAPGDMVVALGVSVAFFALLIALAAVLVCIVPTPKPERSLDQLMLVFTNLAFMGIPIIQAFYGAQGVARKTRCCVVRNGCMARRGCIPARMRRISAGTRSARISCFRAYSRFFRRKRRNGSMPLTGRMTPATSC